VSTRARRPPDPGAALALDSEGPPDVIDLVLKPGREKAALRRHPWVMSGSISDTRGAAAASQAGLARVLSARGEVLGYGDHSPASSIRVRMLSFGSEAPPKDLVEQRIAEAVTRRRGDPLVGDTDAVRLVNAEGDGLPGLVVDRYAEVVVVKLASAGMAGRRDEIAAALARSTGAPFGFERADPTASRREGLESRSGPLWSAGSSAMPEIVAIRERDRRFGVDVAAGQKTGFYLDQRDARDLVARLAEGRRVLDAFCYTGGFAVAAARGGAAHVTLLDSSEAALERAREHLQANAPGCDAVFEKADAFEALRQLAGRPSFDLLVLDPPPLARRQADVPRASRAYKDLLLHGFALAASGARMLAFACSHHVGPELFGKIVFGATLDADREVRLLASLGAPADHPVSVYHPEGRYLTGVLLEVG
jgi:23S rRNA (cytosine1962-C5)-methyltransferase